MRCLALVFSLTSFLLVACDTSPDEPIDAGSAFDAVAPPPRDAGPALCANEGALDARTPTGALDVCNEGIVPMGFGLRWQRAAQRVAHLGFAIDLGDHAPDGCLRSARSRGVTLAVSASGGSVVDDPDPGVAFFDYQVVGARDDSPVVGDGGVVRPRFARASATIDLIDGAIEGAGVALVDLGTTGLLDATDVAVVIEGFDLTTDQPQSPSYPGDWNPVRGYVSRGFGIEIGATSRVGDALRVEVGARFEHGPGGRPLWEGGHDRAIRVARTRAIVRLLAIATDAPPVRETIAYDIAARAPLLLHFGAPCRAPSDVTALVIDGTPGLDRAVVGLSRFDVALWPDQPAAADELREVSVRVRDFTYDQATGRATMHVDAYASNEGPLARRGMDARFEVDVVLAQWTGGGSVETLSISAPAPDGRSAFRLPMMR